MGVKISHKYGIEDFQENVHDYTCIKQEVLDSAANILEARGRTLTKKNVCILDCISELRGIVGNENHSVYLDRGCLVVVGKKNLIPYSNTILAIYATPSNKSGLEKVANELGLPAPKM